MDEKHDHILGVILGTAVGDALGLPYEGLSPRRVARRMGAGGLRHSMLLGRGLISDDTEHTCLVARALIRSRGDPVRFARQLARDLRWWLAALPPGIGWATLRGAVKLWLGFPPGKSGVWSAGNGPAMRAALLGVCARDGEHLRALVRASTRITHRDPRAESGALVVATAARLAAAGIDPTPAVAERLGQDIADERFRALVIRAGSLARYRVTPAEFLAAMEWPRGVSGFVVHTVPAALYCWLRHPDRPRAAITAAVRLGGDTDTCAAIVGALSGARHGAQGLPADWLDGLRDWPLGPRRLRRIAAALAGGDDRAPRLPWPALLARNLAFTALIAAHLVRRAVPP